MQKILSFLIIFSLLMSALSIVPIADDGYTQLNAVVYGTLNNYTRTDEGDGTIVGGIEYKDTANMQTYEKMQEKGFIDKTTIPYVSFMINAPADGRYKIKPHILINGNYTTRDYFFVVSVNDNTFHKCDVKDTGETKIELNVSLTKGINIIRIITRVKETSVLVDNGTWVNVYNLFVEDTLTGIIPEQDLTLYPGESFYISNYQDNGMYIGNVGQHLDSTRGWGFTYESIKIGNINDAPSFSFTVTVPRTGYYDISLKSHTGNIGATGYFVMFVDSKKYKVNYIDYNGYTNASVYIPQGTHTVALTSVWNHSAFSNSYATWCDYFELKFVSGGVALAETQQNPAKINDPTRLEAEIWGNTNDFFESSQVNKDCSGDGCNGNANWDSSIAQSQTSLSTYFDKSNMLYVSFAVEAPEDGEYTITPGYFWNAGTAHNMTLLVNDGDVYSVPFEKRGTLNNNITSATVTLKKGRNIIRMLPYTSDNNAGTSFINVDYLDIDERLTGLDAKSYQRAEAESSVNVNNMSITGDGNLGAPDFENMTTYSFTISTLTIDKLPFTASFSLNITAPADGYYDMTALFYTKRQFSSEPSYFGFLVDGFPTAVGWRRDSANDNGITDLYGVNKADLTTYLTKGDHIITLTCPMSPEIFDKADYFRADFDALLLYGGLSLSEKQTVPEASVSVYYEAENTPYKHHYSARVDSTQPWHAEGNVGGANTAHPMSFEDIGNFIDQNTSYVVFAVNAPKSGSYSMQLRFAIGCTGNKQDLYDKFTAEGGSRPYAALSVNGKAYKVEHPTKCGWISTSDIFTIELNEGVNYIYAFAPTSELMDIMTGAYIDYDALIMQRGLTAVDANLYFLGDVGGDAYFDLRDLLRLKLYMADFSVEIDHVSANIDRDSAYSITATDLAMLKQLFLDPKGEFSAKTFLQEFPEGDTNIEAVCSQPLNKSWLVDISSTVRVVSTENATSDGVNINVTSTKKQLVEGFGASITDTTAYNLKQLPKYERTKLFKDLFSDSEGDALDLTFLRQPLGACDFTVGSYYTYDDVEQGSTDTSLSNFSLGRDYDRIIPMIKEAQEINPNMRFVSSIWTAPLWMKAEWSWYTVAEDGTSVYAWIEPSYYSVYARYIVKALKAYELEGIHIDYMSAQNEPDGNHGIPATWFDKWRMETFVADYLYPEFKKNSITTKLLAYDFNWFTTESGNMDRTIGFIKGPNNKLDGVNYGIAFHPYAGSIEVQQACHSYYPDMPIYITEAAGNTDMNNFFNSIDKAVLSLRNHASAYIYWNIMLDENRGPLVDVNSIGIGLTEYNTTKGNYTKLSDYYALAHFSKYIKENAYVVESTDTVLDITNVIALNPDGTYSAVINNNKSGNSMVNINLGNGYVIQVAVPARSVISLSWNPATVSQYAE